MVHIKDHSLYLVISTEYALGRDIREIALKAIAGGVDIIQMREKDKPGSETVRLGKEIAALCKEKDVMFIVNDDPLLAAEAGADGVHLGQEDLLECPLERAKKLMGPERIVGVSTHSPAQFKTANDSGADYVSYGPIFPTKAKNYCVGTEEIENILKAAKKPVFFIGGINLNNIDELLSKGARNIAVIRAITEADDITAAAKRLKEKIIKGRN
jgi:thiamine-phosphate pyrophosphorylase